MTYPCRVLSISIDRPVATVARYLAEPRNFPQWASGLAGGLRPKRAGGEDHEWLAEGPGGPVTIRFTAANPFGIADHWVFLADGSVVYVPMRTVANAEGSEVSLTLFRTPAMDEASFRADVEWVERDLSTLKRVLEAAGPA